MQKRKFLENGVAFCRFEIILIVKTEIVCTGFNINHGDCNFDMIIIKKNYFDCPSNRKTFWRQNIKSSQSQKSALLVEGKDKCDWFTRVLLLFRLEAMATLDQNTTQFVFAQCFDFTRPFDKVATVLNRISFRWATSAKLDLSFNWNLSPSEKIEAWEWYGLLRLSFLSSAHHVLDSNHYIPRFSAELPWPVHCFYVNQFYLSWQLAPFRNKETWSWFELIWSRILAFDVLAKESDCRKPNRWAHIFLKRVKLVGRRK